MNRRAFLLSTVAAIAAPALRVLAPGATSDYTIVLTGGTTSMLIDGVYKSFPIRIASGELLKENDIVTCIFNIVYNEFTVKVDR